ncbi:pyridoxamine 5-phosphate oxidase [Paracoccus sp. (in: a-proteobacteria)]|uniref:pyridoxamine 5-phosphate oxidase n=1 Tax=Paracoccus sp. TaxID=267 RepID=UPI003A84895D
MAIMGQNPIRTDSDEARAMARMMLAAMRHATLAVLDPDSGHPHLSRIACQPDDQGLPVALLSGLAAHSRALAADPRAGLLIDPAAPKGDPMTWPRLSLRIVAQPLSADPARRDRWLAGDPKARIYVDLPDFRFWRLTPLSGFLNAGFGAAFRLTPADMTAPPQGNPAAAP